MSQSYCTVLRCVRHDDWDGPKIGRLLACDSAGEWADSRDKTNGQFHCQRCAARWWRLVGHCAGRARTQAGGRAIPWSGRESAGRRERQSQLLGRVLAWFGRGMESYGQRAVLDGTIPWLRSDARPMAVAVQCEFYGKRYQVSSRGDWFAGDGVLKINRIDVFLQNGCQRLHRRRRWPM